MNLYQEQIIDHYKSPHNWGEIKDADKVLEGANVSCGDDLTIYLKLDQDQKITEVKWHGRACAICIASASILSDQIKGQTLTEIEKISTDDIRDNLGIPLSPIRLKCALLPLETLKRKLNCHSRLATPKRLREGELVHWRRRVILGIQNLP